LIKEMIINKIKGYLNIAIKGSYVIFGADNLKGYNHKLYLVIYREDCGKSISKLIDGFKVKEIECLKLSVDDMTNITNNDNCKLLAIKNKGLSDQIVKLYSNLNENN